MSCVSIWIKHIQTALVAPTVFVHFSNLLTYILIFILIQQLHESADDDATTLVRTAVLSRHARVVRDIMLLALSLVWRAATTVLEGEMCCLEGSHER